VESRARSNTTFAVKIEGHLYDRNTGKRLHKIEAVKIIANRISLPVNLSKPDLLVLVKSVRLSRALTYASIMVAPPCVIYSKYKNRNVCRPWWL